MGAILEIEGLTKDFRHNWTMRRFRALHGVDLAVQEGEIFGLVGPNGAGKTTTFKLLFGLLRPTAGTIRFRGSALDVPRRAEIGFLPEAPYFYDYLTVTETLDLYARLYGMSAAGRQARVAEVTDQLQLGHKRSASLRSLSKGTLQRVGVAQAILNRPRLVILDEPMSGLDPMGRRHMRELIRSLGREGTTVIFSSHILPDAEALCDRVGILTGGRLRELCDLRGGGATAQYELTVRDIDRGALAALERLAAGPAAENGMTWTLHMPGGEAVGSALDVVRGAGGAVESLVPVHRSLEERFLFHVGNESPLD
jgi:ABC-2 type transport system ATP-binding protein